LNIYIYSPNILYCVTHLCERHIMPSLGRMTFRSFWSNLRNCWQQHPLVKSIFDTYLVCFLWSYFRNLKFFFFQKPNHALTLFSQWYKHVHTCCSHIMVALIIQYLYTHCRYSKKLLFMSTLCSALCNSLKTEQRRMNSCVLEWMYYSHWAFPECRRWGQPVFPITFIYLSIPKSRESTEAVQVLMSYI